MHIYHSSKISVSVFREGGMRRRGYRVLLCRIQENTMISSALEDNGIGTKS